MMVEKGTGAALVSDDETPVPRIVTERDILISVGGGEDPDAELVADHMSDSVIAAAPDWSLERAAAEMSRRGIRHLVVFDDGGAGRRALDPRHRPRLDLRGGDLGDDAGLGARSAQSRLRAAGSSRPAARRRGPSACAAGGSSRGRRR